MTTAIIHGDPGSYKTATLVNDYLVPAIKEGRLVVTNIRGVKTVDEIAELYKFELPDTAEIINVSFDSEGFQKIARFFHWVPQGALILMDEGQRIYPTRLRNFSEYDNPSADETRPKTVEDAFDSHRHMNWDIFISTTNIGKVHKEIRAVAEFGYRHKNLASVFKFLKGRYKRVSHNAENSGNAVGHTISSTFKKIDPRCFDVYQSTATGQTKDSSSSLTFFRQPRVLLLLAVIIYSAINLGSTLVSNDGLPSIFGGSRPTPLHQTGTQASGVPVKAPAGLSAGSHGERINSAAAVQLAQFSPTRIYYAGSINDELLFQVEFEGDQYVNLGSTELTALGYVVTYQSDAFVRLTYGDSAINVFPRPSDKHRFSDPTVMVDPTQNVTAAF